MTNFVDNDISNNDWIPILEVAKLLVLSEKTIKKYCRDGKLAYKIIREKNESLYYISLSSLPKYYQDKYLNEIKSLNKTYSEAPEWAKQQAEKYCYILNLCEDIKGNELKKFVFDWNSNHNQAKDKISYSNLMKMRKRYQKYGINGLLSKYGHKKNSSIISHDDFIYFKTLFLVEGGPSYSSCWDLTLGHAMKINKEINKDNFPCLESFKRKLKREIPEQSIYLARKGFMAWNRNFGGYIERDYSNIVSGKVWVSDHAQIDVATKTEDGRVVFPWVTVWRDYKSGKWLGWILQTGSPNSDLIFQSFYYAAKNYGLPEDVIIDNGKDYRSKDFAGGRKINNEAKTHSMLNELNVNVHFALPYNAQTKPVERDFNKIKELLSKHCVGYRGGNVVERPEKLLKEIKDNKILNFEDFKKIFDDFITNVVNKRPVKGKNHNGLTPDKLFEKEFKEKIIVSKDALKLFCTRTSKTFTIARNGIKDNSLGITYWEDWMISKTGLKIYLRRDPQNYKDAWVFKADDNEFIGVATAVKAVAALHADKISKEEFKTAMAIKKRNYNVTKSYLQQSYEISLEEQCENYKTAYASVEKKLQPQISKISNTNMDKAIRKNKEMQEAKNIDLSELLVEEKEEEPFYLFETDKIIAEELKGVANGY